MFAEKLAKLFRWLVGHFWVGGTVRKPYIRLTYYICK